MDAEMDIQKFAEKLVEAGREAVVWERRKLEWLLEEKKREAEKSKAA